VVAEKDGLTFWEWLLIIGLIVVLPAAALNLAVVVIGVPAGLVLFDLVGTPYGWLFVVGIAALAAVEVWFWIKLGRSKTSAELIEATPRLRLLITFVYGLVAIAGLIALTGAFAVLTAALQSEGLVSEKPASSADGFVWSTLGYYAWHLLDAIPVLEVPETLNWAKPPTKFTDYYAGTLLLLFKLVAIIPIVGFTVATIAAWKTKGADADTSPARP
jgi:hypothetical protein